MTGGRHGIPKLGIPKLGIIVAGVALMADQLTKYIIIEKVMRPEGVVETPFVSDRMIEVLPFFQLRMAWNTGISFSLFNSGEPMTIALLLAIQFGVTGLLIWWLRQMDRPLMQVACGLVIGGALGNIVDRIMFSGAVADFLDFYWRTWHFPTFNLADSCISVGAGLWLLDAVLARPQAADHIADNTKDPAP